VGSVFERSGTDANAAKYISFSCEGRTLDIELSTAEAAAFVFKKFADLFQAYATAQIEKLKGEAVTIRVAAIVDGGASSKPAPAAKKVALQAPALPAHTPGAFPGRGPPPPAFPYGVASPAPRGGFAHPLGAATPSYRM